jgi:hypothetical protein
MITGRKSGSTKEKVGEWWVNLKVIWGGIQ